MTSVKSALQELFYPMLKKPHEADILYSNVSTQGTEALRSEFTHSLANSKVRIGSQAWLFSESTLTVFYPIRPATTSSTKYLCTWLNTWSLGAHEIPSAESETQEAYRTATTLQVYSCNFERVSPLRKVKLAAHMITLCTGRSWL